MSDHDSMMHPEIEELLNRASSKFSLCTLASARARQINAYFGQLGDTGLGAMIPPQVTSVARKPLSISFEEIAADKIVPVKAEELEKLLPPVETPQPAAEVPASEPVAVSADVKSSNGENGSSEEIGKTAEVTPIRAAQLSDAMPEDLVKAANKEALIGETVPDSIA